MADEPNSEPTSHNEPSRPTAADGDSVAPPAAEDSSDSVAASEPPSAASPAVESPPADTTVLVPAAESPPAEAAAFALPVEAAALASPVEAAALAPPVEAAALAPPVETPPVETPPVETPPAEPPPVETPPAEPPPVETPPEEPPPEEAATVTPPTEPPASAAHAPPMSKPPPPPKRNRPASQPVVAGTETPLPTKMMSSRPPPPPARRAMPSSPPTTGRPRPPSPPSPPRPPPIASVPASVPAPPVRAPLSVPAPVVSGPLPNLPPLAAPPQAAPPQAAPAPIAEPPRDVRPPSTPSLAAPGSASVLMPPASFSAELRLHAARGLLAALRAELEQDPKPLRAGRVQFEIGRLCESPLSELEPAAEAYLKAHALLGDHVPSIRGARRTLLALGRAEETVALFDAELKLTAEPEAKAQLLYEKAGVLEDSLGQREAARVALELGAELVQGNTTRIKATERAEALAHAWEPLGRALERDSNAVKSDSAHRSALLGARARLLEAHRGDPHTAAEVYQSAAAADPENSSALHALKRLHYGHERWRDLIAVLEREAELTTDPAVRAMAHYRVGRIWLDRLGSVDEALSAMEVAARETAVDPMVLQELARLYELAGRNAELAKVLERLSARAGSTANQLSYFERLGELYRRRLADDAQAVTWYERARAVDPCYVPALQALSELYERRSEFEKLTEVLLGEAEAALDPARRAACFARVAEIYETNMGRPGQAMQQHGRALGVVPGYATSFKALVRLLTQSQNYSELVELHERAVDLAADAESKVTSLYKIGRLYEDALASPAQAFVAYRRILELLPQELGALHALQRAAERAELFQELIAALELEAERAPGTSRKVQLLHRAGEVAETDLKDDTLAINLFKRVFELDESFAPAFASLGRLYHKAGRWEELLDTYESELKLLAKGPAQSALQFKIGQLHEERLGHNEEALQAYRRAVEADPGHHAAVRALERKLEQKGLWDELVRVLEAELGALEEPKLRARTLLRIGEVQENRLRAPDQALLAYQRALASDSELSPARDARIRLLSAARDYPHLVQELEREAAAQRDVRLSIWALLRAAEVYRDDLKDPAEAVRIFEAVLARNPAHVEALLALEALYAERGAWDSLANVYATEARVLSDPSARVAALRELGRLQQSGKVSAADHGRSAYAAILELLPRDAGALFALERVALADGDGALLAQVDFDLAQVPSDPASVAVHETRLGEALEAAGDPAALGVFRAAVRRDGKAIGAARGLSRIADLSGDPVLLSEAAEREARMELDVARAASGLVAAAERLRSFGELERATHALSRALEIDPDHEAAAIGIGELLLSRGDVERLLSLLTRAAGAAKAPGRVSALWSSVADLYANRKQDLAAALAVLERALNLHPKQIPLLMKLAELYQKDGQWQTAAERLKQALGGNPDAQTTIEANLRLAVVYDKHLGDADEAFRHLTAVLDLDPNHRGALDRLTVVQARRGELDQAAETAERLMRMSSDSAGRVRALTLLARVERQRGKIEPAAHALEQVVSTVGVEGTGAKEFREWIRSVPWGEEPTFTRYLGALVRYAESTSHPAPAAFAEIGRTLADELSQPDQALEWLARGLAVHPNDVGLRTELGARLLRAGQDEQALVEFEHVVALDVDQPLVWRALTDALDRSPRRGDGSVGRAALVALGFANEQESANWQSRVPRTATAAPGWDGERDLSALSPLGSDDPVARLIAALGDVSGKLHPPELERWGVATRDRVNPKSGHPLRVLADRLADIFHLADFDLYIHQAHSGLVELELTDPLSVLVPIHVTSLSESEQTFLLARALCTAARDLAPAERLSPSALSMLLLAAARLAVPNFPAREHDEEALSLQARKLSRALPWLGRTPIEEAAKAYAEAPQRDVADWRLSVKMTAARAAALVADDLPGGVELILRLEGGESGHGAAAAQATHLSRDLVHFWVSEPAALARKKLGFG